MTDYIALEDQFTSGMYYKRPVVLTRGLGSRVWDVNGKEYLDCTAGIGVANLGHSHPVIVKALQEQAERLITCHELFYNDQRALLLQRLQAITPPELNKFFFCNSGTEANEAAFKFARMSTGRQEIVAFMRGYHGKTFGSLSATWESKYREPFAPLVPGFISIPYDQPEAAGRAITEKTAAVIVEVIQGEGGVRPGSTQFFCELRRLCSARGALLIFDEVQTGLGRTGRMFAFEHHNVTPDMLTLSKSIAGGVPMGVLAFGDKIKNLIKLAHTTTFGGNPLACAVARAVLDFLVAENIPSRAAELGEYFLSELRLIQSARLRQVRGKGLMIGIELKEKAGPLAQQLVDEGLLVLLAGTTVLRLLPPLTISREDIDFALSRLRRVLA